MTWLPQLRALSAISFRLKAEATHDVSWALPPEGGATCASNDARTPIHLAPRVASAFRRKILSGPCSFHRISEATRVSDDARRLTAHDPGRRCGDRRRRAAAAAPGNSRRDTSGRGW